MLGPLHYTKTEGFDDEISVHIIRPFGGTYNSTKACFDSISSFFFDYGGDYDKILYLKFY